MCRNLQIFVLQGLSITSSVEERSPDQHPQPPPTPPIFEGTNKTVPFRLQLGCLPQLQSASVTCIIVRSQTHSPPVTETKTPYHLEVSDKTPQQPRLVSRLMNNDERMNKYDAQNNAHRSILLRLANRNAAARGYMSSMPSRGELRRLVRRGEVRRFWWLKPLTNSCGHRLKS